MTIELDTTLAQAEVLFLSFAQLLADIDRRQAEKSSTINDLRRRGSKSSRKPEVNAPIPMLSDNLRDLLTAGR